MASPPASLTAALHGRYRLDRELGQGGMATVYLAEDLKHGRRVAVKVLRPELAAALGPERFLREITTTAGLRHPHILPLYDSGEAEHFLFYVMPFIEGESLRQRLDREKQLPLEDALRIARQVADALGYAHGLDIIHRDIKPENILLERGHAIVADFGIAQAVRTAGEARLTQSGLAVGTPAYMSPEQSAGETDLDCRTDIYALGSVLYEMLAGEPPYSGPTAQSVIARRFVEPVPTVRRLRPLVPPGVEQALRTALALVPADRFPSCERFVQALAAPAEPPPRGPSIAVLPFRNLSADPENEYFADGITEDVIAQLSKVRALTVISRTSAMAFKGREQGLRDIAARLQVATLLDGSVRRAGDRVRIVAQLVDAGTEQNLWAATYDRQLTDIFAIQADVALQIAAALKAELSPGERSRIGKEPTSDIRAYQLYLQGRQCFIKFTPEGMRTAIAYYRQAVASDPGYALALASIALAYVELGENGGFGPDENYIPAREAAARALALDPDLAEAHTAQALLMVVCDFDWRRAEEEYQRALELNPNSADTYDFYGRMLSALARHDEAIAATRRAWELDPLAHPMDLPAALLRAGRFEEAAEAALRGIALETNYARAHATLGWARLKQGRTDEGLAGLQKAVALSPGNTLWLAQLGQGYAEAHRLEEARQVLRELQEIARTHRVSPYHMAYLYTGLGEQDQAIDCLERAFEERTGAVHAIKSSFLFAPLRGHPRFKALLARMNLA